MNYSTKGFMKEFYIFQYSILHITFCFLLTNLSTEEMENDLYMKYFKYGVGEADKFTHVALLLHVKYLYIGTILKFGYKSLMC